MKILKRLGSSRELLVLIVFAGANLAGVVWDGSHATECSSANAPQIVGCQAIRDSVGADDAGAARSGNLPMAGSARHRIRPHAVTDQGLFLPELR